MSRARGPDRPLASPRRAGSRRGRPLRLRHGAAPLRVSIQIDLVSPAGKTTRIKRSRRGNVDNCAEGGPNFGFDLTPKAYKMACANGRWKPGRYALTTRTLDIRSGTVAQASLYHQVTKRC